jgi:transposase InsO family protein
MWLFGKLGKKDKENSSNPVRFKRSKHKHRRGYRKYTVAQKVELIKEYEKSKLSLNSFSLRYSVAAGTLQHWLVQYQAQGEAGLVPLYRGRTKIEVEEAVKAEIIRLKKDNPMMGIGKMSDWLARNKFIRINKMSVLRILRENPETEGLVVGTAGRKARKHPTVQRFERSRARQMYQMDIMTWMLRGLHRVYVIVCLDDYSRFVVSFGIFRRARTSETIDVLKAAIEQYGMPEEVLTDNGPQFYTWRGRSEFQKYLIRSGIRAVRSRPRHPETLGKVESFWRNLYQEMLSRVPIASFEEAQETIREWVQFYNYKRPHQGIEGLVPADRFFGVEKSVREAMEQGAAIVKDALVVDPKRIKEPMYLVGRVDGKEIKLIAREGSIVVSGLDEVEKRDSLEAVEGVKLSSEAIKDGGNRAEYSPESNHGTSAGKIPQEDPGASKSDASGGSVAEEKDGTGSMPGAGDKQGGVLQMGEESTSSGGESTGTGEHGPQEQGLCGGASVAQ